ncbi:MAG: AEC family transporter [Hyphomicrobiaceae bacterium]|nr:AEC family transporter [Hyphomicrobiaceae bacterium]
MTLFIEILTNVTMPIVVLMALGSFIQRKLDLNVRTLSRLLLNVLLPCALFHFLTSAELPLGEVWPTVWFTILQFLVLVMIGWGLAALLRVQDELRPVIGLAAAFANSGNFGLPVAQLAFPPDYLLHQTLIVSLHGILIIPYGVLLLARERGSIAQSLKTLLLSPMMLAVFAGLLVKMFEINLPALVVRPVELIAQAYVSIALFTLGAQLSDSRFSMPGLPVWLAVGLRMLVAPALTWGVVLALGFEPQLIDLLVVAAAAPVGLLLAIFCADYERRPDVAGAMVLVSTVLSPIIVSAWIWLMRVT